MRSGTNSTNGRLCSDLYADARPSAIVLLANYGPVGAAVMKSVRSSVFSRCHAIGDVRPAGGGLGAFGRMLDPFVQAVPSALIATDRVGWVLEHFAVELSWRRQGVDLDLHVATGSAACGYLTPQGLAEATFARDDRGEGAPPFHEAIYVVPGDSDRFEVFVHAFSGSHTVAAADATVTLIYRTTSGVTLRNSVDLGSANGQAWHVASFARDVPEPMLRASQANGFVVGYGWSP